MPFLPVSLHSFTFLSLDNNSIFPIENIIVDYAVGLCVDNRSHTAPRTLVSMSLGVFLARASLSAAQSEKQSHPEISVDVRMCRDCKSIVFGKRDFARESAQTPKYVGIYQVPSPKFIG